MNSILFVCTGNICRSPMAEYYARARCGPGIGVSGAGTWTRDGRPPSEGALSVMAEVDIDLSAHRSRDLWNLGPLQEVKIYAMTGEQRDEIEERLPGTDVSLLDPLGRSIPDPYGGSLAAYRLVRDAIFAAVDARTDDWSS